MTTPAAWTVPWSNLGRFVLGALAFAAVYTQAPLYYSNQNQYFLHGLADAGEGFLGDDWLAQTADPTPVFSFLVSVTARYLHPFLFHAYYVLLFGVYLASLVGVYRFVAQEKATLRVEFWFVVVLLALHSALARWASYRLFGLDYPWYFQAGVAGQYVLGAMFQPSTFGVLLILSIWLFIKDRPLAAVAVACAGATAHSTYLLGAAMLTVAYMLVLWREGQVRKALYTGGLSLALALPVTLFVLLTFRPESTETFRESQEILVHFRIPHHCLPHLWCDPIAIGQIAWMVLAMWLVRGSRLGWVMLVSFLLAAVLTLTQVATGSDSLALLFPWRISAVLMPVGTAVILGRLMTMASQSLDTHRGLIAGLVILTGLVISGVLLQVFRQGFQSAEETGLVDFVKENRKEGEVYLIPVQLPNLAKTTRGSLSSDFKPIAAKKTDARLIPVNFQNFRLETGVPVFADFKSIPYKDADVLEWRARLDLADGWGKKIKAGRFDEVRTEVRQRGITHVVVPVDQKIAGAKEVYRDGLYRVFRVRE